MKVGDRVETDWPVPDWFRWGYKHRCIVWDKCKEYGKIRDIFAVRYDGVFIACDGILWKHAEPVTDETVQMDIPVRLKERVEQMLREHNALITG